MQYDQDKVDEMALALLFLVTSGHEAGRGARAWKGLDVNILGRLQAKGWIEDPMTKSLSLHLTETGYQKSKELFARHFAPAQT